MSIEGLYRYLGTLASLVKRQARATGSNGQGQSSSTRGSFFDDFKKLGLPYFSSTSNPTEAQAEIMKIEKFFDVINYSEEQILCSIYVRQRGRPLMAHDYEAFGGSGAYCLELVQRGFL